MYICKVFQGNHYTFEQVSPLDTNVIITALATKQEVTVKGNTAKWIIANQAKLSDKFIDEFIKALLNK